MGNKKTTLLVALLMIGGFALTGCQGMMRGMGVIPMGSGHDRDDAAQVWNALAKKGLVGPNAIADEPYKGQKPHGMFLETIHTELTLNGHKGVAIIKRNYAAPGLTLEKVKANRKKYLKAVTVMYQRAHGYDNDDNNWFWAKYKPDGTLHVKKKMMMKIKLAGRVAKGKSEGCIACHQGAPGGDFVFSPDVSRLVDKAVVKKK